MPGRSDQQILSAYAAARRRGDDEAARLAWQELAVNNFDRIGQFIKLFRFSAGGRGLPDHEWGSAASEAYLRVIAMGANFKSLEVGAFYAALHRCVENSCRDYGRKELVHDKRAGGSLDNTYEPGGEAGPYDAALAAHDAELLARSRDVVEAERDRLEAEQLVQWGIARIANDKYRAVLERSYCDAPLTGEQIAAELHISPDNVYQRRRRGVQELERILRGL